MFNIDRSKNDSINYSNSLVRCSVLLWSVRNTILIERCVDDVRCSLNNKSNKSQIVSTHWAREFVHKKKKKNEILICTTVYALQEVTWDGRFYLQKLVRLVDQLEVPILIDSIYIPIENLRFFHTTSSETRYNTTYIWYTQAQQLAHASKWWNSMKFLDRSHRTFFSTSLSLNRYVQSSNVSCSHYTFPRSWLIWIRVNQPRRTVSRIVYTKLVSRGGSLMPRNSMLQINNNKGYFHEIALPPRIQQRREAWSSTRLSSSPQTDWNHVPLERSKNHESKIEHD